MRTFSLLAWISKLCLLTSSLAGFQLQDYELESNYLPDDERFHPPIGNGHVATNVLSDTVYMNGLFNGYEDKSSRARIPAYVSIDVAKEDDINRTYVLDMYNGLFKQKIEKPSYTVVVTYSAHRTLTRLLVTTIQLDRKGNSTESITVKVVSNQGPESRDFFTINQTALTETPDGVGLKYYHGRTKETEVNNTEAFELHVYYTSLPTEIGLQQGEESKLYVFIASHSMQQKDALDNFDKALEDSDSLLQTHKDAWHKVWTEGRVDISGNPELSKNVIAATYNILCSLPTQDDPITPYFGLSPGGLSRGGLLVPEMPGGGHNDYAGHVFWDMDTWMMPPIMLLHPDMGRQMISSRTRVLKQVKQNSMEAGYEGAKFPWEQATTGIEATPKWAGQMSRFEIHINADISYSLRQYLYANDDVTMVTSQRGFELALEIARFWQSRANRTGPNNVEILGVMGPDEYHYNIDNSVYTNYNAKLSLQLPQYIVDKFHLTLNASLQTELRDFNNTANDLVILFDDRLLYHPQYEGFNLSNPRVRQKAYETVARDLGLSKTNKMAPDRITTESICQKDFQCQDQNVKDNNNNIQSPEQKIAKMWKKEEEEMMIHLRLAQDTLFCKSKNHEQLWDRIVDELNKNGVVVTKVQVINKWKALKKKYKEVIDANSKSGNERVDWKYFDTFHEVYGHKASTEPAFSMDSSGKNNKDVADKKTLQTGGRKRKVNSTDKVITVINESNEKLIGEIKSQHDAKMARLDRFLDIFQNAVQTKKD